MAASDLAARTEIRASARLISLLRLLLLAVGMAVLTAFDSDEGTRAVWAEALARSQALLVWVAAATLALVVSVPLVRYRWQLVLHLVFDLIWIGYLIYLSGGVGGPAVVLLFAVVVTATLTLPRFAPFVVSALASLVVATSAAFYLADIRPFNSELLSPSHPLINQARILGNMAVQIGALFLVDVLGQTLARRVHEQRLLISELIGQLDEGVIAIDTAGSVLYANSAANELLELEQDIPTGAKIDMALSEQRFAPVLEALLAEQLPMWQRLQTPNGRQLIARANFLEGRRNKVIGRTLMIADETRLRVLEEDAARAERLAAMGQMAAGIAHEIRNPLLSLRGCAQELGSIAGESDNESYVELSRIMVSEADRLERLIEDFLQLSRMRAPDWQEVDLERLAHEIEALTRHRTDWPDAARFTVSVREGCPTAWADPDQLRQVITNLVNNAIHATAERSVPQVAVEFDVTTEGSGDTGMEMIRVRVSDNGVGMAREQIDKMFTPFFSTRSKGTGLGLTLVDRIISQHGGTVRVDSIEGEGTVVSVTVPICSIMKTPLPD